MELAKQRGEAHIGGDVKLTIEQHRQAKALERELQKKRSQQGTKAK